MEVAIAMETEEGLLRRFRALELSQAKLREQLGLVINNISQQQKEELDLRMRDLDMVTFSGSFARGPYWSVLQHMGHSVYVCRPDTGAIIYWNQSAETLYGWKEYEALGKNVNSLLITNGSHQLFKDIMQVLKSGKTWSGLFPFKKKTEDMFMAMVTKSPLYENGELIGAITVSSDSAMLNDVNLNNSKLYGKEANEKSSRLAMPPQQQIASAVSNLASKIFRPNHVDNNHGAEISQEGCIFGENMQSENARISASKTILRLHARLRAIEEKTYKYEEIISKYNPQSRIEF